jgi:hypothetical protein
MKFWQPNFATLKTLNVTLNETHYVKKRNEEYLPG